MTPWVLDGCVGDSLGGEKSYNRECSSTVRTSVCQSDNAGSIPVTCSQGIAPPTVFRHCKKTLNAWLGGRAANYLAKTV